MSKQQRARIDAILRRPRPEGPRSVEALRTGFAALMAQMIVPDAVRVTRTTLGDRPALHVEPDDGRRAGTILYFHGGGWVFGSPETALSLTGNLVVRTGFAAYSVDYRLAPEHPFPAAIDDTVGAYRALLDSGEDPSAIAFAGDSAGGGLAVTTCLAARDAGLPLPAAIVAFSPGLDATRTGESMDAKQGVDPIFTREALDHTGAMYLGGADPRQPLLSPAVLADLTGFPPILLQVGTNELLLDDSTRLAARARAAGVDVILDVTAGVPHVFQSFAGVLDEADEALDRAAFFLGQRIRAGGAPRVFSPAGSRSAGS
ncbi:alpha/beta hydrolase [Microbispora hainanensis]|uniref:alpha/beta hydrolase n=1 Tax=Microbispora hainanensis TaxID=568844 RepID=UPI0033D69BA7